MSESGLDSLHKQQILIDGMLARDDRSIATKSSQGHMRPKRPLVRLTKRKQQGGAQFLDFMASGALRP